MKWAKRGISCISGFILTSASMSAAAADSSTAATATPDNTQYVCRAQSGGGWQCGEYQPSRGPIASAPRPEKTVVVRSRSNDDELPKEVAAELKQAERASTESAAEAAVPQPATDDAVANGAATELDWVPLASLKPEQEHLVLARCTGAYVQPGSIDPADDPETAPLQASAANSIESTAAGAKLEGDVRLKQGYRELHADRAEVDKERRTALLEGDVRYREPGVLLKGERAEADMNTGAAIIDGADYVLHEAHARGESERLTRREDEVVVIENGSYTTCPPGSNAWKLSADRVELNQATGYGTARDVVVRVADVPIFWAPYWFFPLESKRESGFLFPSGGVSSENGVEIATPYYLNLAPNYDATLIPRYYSKRGAALEGEFRYLSRRDFGSFSAAYMPDDDETSDARWLYGIDERGRWGEAWHTRIDYTAVSDDEYFEDLGTELNVSSATNLLRLGELTRRGDWWDFEARLQGYQSLSSTVLEANKPYYRLPQLRFGGTGGFGGPVEYLLDSEYTWFDHDRQNSGMTAAQIAAGAAVKGHRAHIEPGLRIPLRWAAGFLDSGFKLKHTQYFLEDTPAGWQDHNTRTVPTAWLDGGLLLEKQSSWFGNDYTQTLEPRAHYLWAPYRGQGRLPNFDSAELAPRYDALFREERFTGLDRLGDNNRLSLGLTTRFLADGSGREVASASVGKSIYFRDREVQLPGVPDDNSQESPIISEATFRPDERQRLLLELHYDERDDDTDLLGFGYRFQSDSDRILNLAYRYRPVIDVEQTDLSLIQPLWRDWSILARWNRDWKHDRSLEAFAGLEYDSCCWRMRIVWRRWIADGDPAAGDDSANSGVFLQFVMKGLGGVGSKLDTILDDGIPGYRQREDESNPLGGSMVY